MGIYPEIKLQPSADGVRWHNIVRGKAADHPHRPTATWPPVFIQSFGVSNLQCLNTRANIRLAVDADDVKDGGGVASGPVPQAYDFVVRRTTPATADLLTSTSLVL